MDDEIAETTLAGAMGRIRSLIETSVSDRDRSTVNLSWRAGVSRATLWAFRSGGRVPRMDVVFRIAAALGYRLEVRLVPRTEKLKYPVKTEDL
jgi:DNA-binding phage protein